MPSRSSSGPGHDLVPWVAPFQGKQHSALRTAAGRLASDTGSALAMCCWMGSCSTRDSSSSGPGCAQEPWEAPFQGKHHWKASAGEWHQQRKGWRSDACGSWSMQLQMRSSLVWVRRRPACMQQVIQVVLHDT